MKITITAEFDTLAEAQNFLIGGTQAQIPPMFVGEKAGSPPKMTGSVGTGVPAGAWPFTPEDSGTELRKNVNPGKPSIGKIGSGTKDEIIATLKKGVQPAAKYAEHMKLLWERDEVMYDGKEYYLP